MDADTSRKVHMLKRVAFEAWKRARDEGVKADAASTIASTHHRAQQSALIEQCDAEEMIRGLGGEPIDHDAPPPSVRSEIRVRESGWMGQ